MCVSCMYSVGPKSKCLTMDLPVHRIWNVQLKGSWLFKALAPGAQMSYIICIIASLTLPPSLSISLCEIGPTNQTIIT